MWSVSNRTAKDACTHTHTHTHIRSDQKRKIKSAKIWPTENHSNYTTEKLKYEMLMMQNLPYWWSHKISHRQKQNENKCLQHRMPLSGTVIEFTMISLTMRYTIATVCGSSSGNDDSNNIDNWLNSQNYKMHIVQTQLPSFSLHNSTLCIHHPLSLSHFVSFKNVNALHSQRVYFYYFEYKGQTILFIFERSKFWNKQSPVVRQFFFLFFVVRVIWIFFYWTYFIHLCVPHVFLLQFFLSCCSKIHLKMFVASQNDIRFLARIIMQFSQVRFSSFMLGYLYRINCFLLVRTLTCIYLYINQLGEAVWKKIRL